MGCVKMKKIEFKQEWDKLDKKLSDDFDEINDLIPNGHRVMHKFSDNIDYVEENHFKLMMKLMNKKIEILFNYRLNFLKLLNKTLKIK
jgi:hypothetical protein